MDDDSPETSEHHARRSEFIRQLVQGSTLGSLVARASTRPPKVIVQYWHDPGNLPSDVGECIQSWARLRDMGFDHRLFDQVSARAFIVRLLGKRQAEAFDLCYHPSMQSDYFRLCYLRAVGGFYVDADDVCITDDLSALFADGHLKLQPLCYDKATHTMVPPTEFLPPGAFSPEWIFYFNNNPLVACAGNQIISYALNRATRLLEVQGNGLPEIQETTGPGNITRSVFDLGAARLQNISARLAVIKDWDAIATSRWPLSYRDDARNWRLSNQKAFDFKRWTSA